VIDLFFLTALVGATLIVVRGTIFRFVRRLWPAFFGCSQCVGFWVGALGPLAIRSRESWIEALVMGCVVSVVAMATDVVLCKLAGGPADAD
jgi:hypothetical protein